MQIRKKNPFFFVKNMYVTIFNFIHNLIYQKVFSEHFFFFCNISLPKVKSFYQSFYKHFCLFAAYLRKMFTNLIKLQYNDAYIKE